MKTKEKLTYKRSIFIFLVRCATFTRMMNAHTPTMMADPDEPTRTLNYSRVGAGAAKLDASLARPGPAQLGATRF